ncbi:cytidine/deoxycytidylate deaminase family protein [Mycoplasmopsis agassizii]|uniref:Cytidine deaminase n=1 Tax=Mycoplasmopsis agassizii TaxID=33922 RepID=A0ABX4H6B3_9BACT|nr:dCMP deaminase family protein [Mycoplasmopsis agassizii]PAF55411.1 cytidine deaminase [Mycoplasmopsis agassizii]SMC18320.1 dCMP deaminase [Mycoplasmopsis agassizii]
MNSKKDETQKHNISWDEYFMSLAKVSSFRSKDPNTKVGAVIVNDNKRIVSLGYNGMPKGNDNFPWNREGMQEKDKKYAYVVHAETNAILNSKTNLENTICFTTLFPCSNCAKTIVQAGIKEVVYLDDFYDKTEDNLISKTILQQSNVKIRAVEKLEVSLKTDSGEFK